MQIIKHIVPLVALGLACACARSPLAGEADANQQEGSIRFSTQVIPLQLDYTQEVWAKGIPLTDVAHMSSMGVFAFLTDSPWAASGASARANKMENVRLNSRIDGVTQHWDYETGKEQTWQGVPYNQYLSFFGYAPFATAANGVRVVSDYTPGGDVGVPLIRYTVPTDVTAQADLMVAVPRTDIVRSDNTIPFTYRHVLTAVGFKISGNGQKVTGISLRGISTQGDLRLNITESDDPVWSNLAVPSAATPFAAAIVPDAGQTYYTATATPTAIMAANGYLMMIPQTLGSEAVVVVDFEGAPSKAYRLDTKEWLPGRRVTYAINVNPTSMVISPADWLNAAAASGTLEITVTGATWRANLEGTGLTMSDQTGVSGDKVTLTWADNISDPEPSKRFAAITFTVISDGYGSTEFHTSQLGEGPPWVLYNGVKWGRGNLIANGVNGCKIGAPTDGGLYFQFGGLIGYKGGADGTGVGRVNLAWSYKNWGGSAVYSADNDIAVWPSAMTLPKPVAFPIGFADLSLLGEHFFQYGKYPYDDANTYRQNNIVPFTNYAGISDGTHADKAVGDPCTYYLGADWSMPSFEDFAVSLLNNQGGNPWKDPALVNAQIDEAHTNILFGGVLNIPICGMRSTTAVFTGLVHADLGLTPNVQLFATAVRGTMNAWAFDYYWYNKEKTHVIDLYSSQKRNALPMRCVYHK